MDLIHADGDFNELGIVDFVRYDGIISLEPDVQGNDWEAEILAEDFSRYLKLAPGALLRIGTGGGFDNHHPAFTADPAALFPTARFWASLAERELSRLQSS